MKRFLILLIIVIAMLPYMSHSHISENEAGITSTFHIDPGDRAVVGKNSVLQFEIEDINDAFAFNECDCTIRIMRNGEIVFTSTRESVQYITGRRFRLNYIFETKELYEVELQGIPYNTQSFVPFSFTYPVDVEDTTSINFVSSFNHFVYHSSHLLIYGFGLIGACYIIFRNEERNTFV